MSRFLDARFETLTPYTPGEQPRVQNLIKLNTNESPYPPSPLAVQAAQVQAQGLQLYSNPACTQAVVPLAACLGVQPQQVFVGNGSDEVLALCFAALCPQGAAFADITYGFYPVWAALCGLRQQIIPLRNDFTLAVADYAGLGKTIFIANPNAPTGLALTPEEIEEILRTNKDNLVVVDEAYVDFGAQSVVPLLQSYQNLMVVGTFSKSRQLAGGRFGYAVASPALIEDLNRIKFSFNPYNVNSMTLAAAAGALRDAEYFERCRQKVINTRARTLQALRRMGFEVTDSLANFVFVKHPKKQGKTLYEELRQKGVLVRHWDAPRISEYLRISIGTDAQMDALFAALEELL